MIDKKENIKNFICDFEKSIDSLIKVCINNSKNICLINVNTPFVITIIRNKLLNDNFSLFEPTSNDLNNKSTLGEFLRNKINNYGLNHKSILLLDFAFEYSHIYLNDENFSNAINVNRDWFTKFNNNVIIFTKPKLTHAIRKHSDDFWSCVGTYIDTTKWFFTPIVPPVSKIRISINPSKYLMEAFENSEEQYKLFFKTFSKIHNVQKYTHSCFIDLYKEINEFQKPVFYYVLMKQFISVFTQIDIDIPSVYNRIQDFKSIVVQDCLPIDAFDIQFLLAEFFYNCGEYEYALKNYRISYQQIYDSWEDKNKPLVMMFISFNIAICEYLKIKVHNPELLEKKLLESYEAYSSNLTNEQKTFSKNFITLAGFTCKHHSYVQHKDILLKLNSVSLQKMEFIDYSETFWNTFFWESFILDNNRLTFVGLNDNPLQEIYGFLQLSLSEFMKGNHPDSIKAIKKAIRLSRKNNYKEILEIIYIFLNNMESLYKKSIKSDYKK